MSEILNRREQIKAASLPPEIPAATGYVKPTDKASASKLGLVKVGDGLQISSAGVLSVSGGGGGGVPVIDCSGETLTSTDLAAMKTALTNGTPLVFKYASQYTDLSNVYYTSVYCHEVSTETGNEYNTVNAIFTGYRGYDYIYVVAQIDYDTGTVTVPED